MIKGWDLAVARMKKGERSNVTIKADYGYGASGSPPKIPGKGVAAAWWLGGWRAH